MSPVVTRAGAFDMQVCIPADRTDDAIRTFAEAENPSGTMNGWQIRRAGDPERRPCHDRAGYVHVMLDA